MKTMTHSQEKSSALPTDPAALRVQVEDIVNTTPVVDMHTHLFPPAFEGLCLFGIDELLTYHYLIAETFRSAKISYERFWRMSKTEQADLVWRALFIDRSPISEATRGVVTVLEAFGLDTRARTLDEARQFFKSRSLTEHVTHTLDIARVKEVVMTNDPLDDLETGFWTIDLQVDDRFRAALRLDGIVNDWLQAANTLSVRGIPVNRDLDQTTITTLRSFLDTWIHRMSPVYLAVSLPADFSFETDDTRNRLLRELILPTATEHGLPLTLMIGVRRGVNPALRGAGDGLDRADVTAVEQLCAYRPDVKFFVTFLSRENQHALCVAARKFNNLMPFGCWWFLNTPSIVYEITRERIELLGTSFIPQHSDARVLEQLIYKWKHARREIAEALYRSYEQLLHSGRAVTSDEISRDVSQMFSGNFDEWVGGSTTNSLVLDRQLAERGIA